MFVLFYLFKEDVMMKKKSKTKRWKFYLFVLISIAILVLVGTTSIPVWNGITKGLDLQGGFEVLYQADPGQKVDKKALYDTATALRNRIDILGVTEPEVTVEEPDRIRIQLAGVKDPAKAREILGKPAQLTFRDPTGKQILLKGTDLEPGGAKLDYGSANQPVVSIKLKDAKKFEEITRKYLHQPLPIYLDEKMLSNPVVNSVISNGQAIIEGNFTTESAQELAELLNAGALPIKMHEVSSFAVDASLGEESLRYSLEAGMYAILAIFIFMIGYYRLPGLVSVISLILYGYLVLLSFDLFQMTMTLPGVAAFILGIGMAVDANVIMNERIREELRKGKSIKAAVRSGSRRSFLTIFDSNLTTIIAALVLFYFGTAGVKGFSLSLITGVLVSFLTAVALSRFLLNLLVDANVITSPAWFSVKEDEISEL
jgi:preprotein translocase subunit SecD